MSILKFNKRKKIRQFTKKANQYNFWQFQKYSLVSLTIENETHNLKNSSISILNLFFLKDKIEDVRVIIIETFSFL